MYTLKINCKGKRTVERQTKNKCRKNVICFKKLEIKIIKKRKAGEKMEKERKMGKKENTELQNPKVVAEFYNSNKKV